MMRIKKIVTIFPYTKIEKKIFDWQNGKKDSVENHMKQEKVVSWFFFYFFKDDSPLVPLC